MCFDFVQGPFRFLDNFRNPCWLTSATGQLACLPFFFLAGFPKCGTTELYVKLHKHQHVAKLLTKEPHWLTRLRYQNESESPLCPYWVIIICLFVSWFLIFGLVQTCFTGMSLGQKMYLLRVTHEVMLLISLVKTNNYQLWDMHSKILRVRCFLLQPKFTKASLVYSCNRREKENWYRFRLEHYYFTRFCWLYEGWDWNTVDILTDFAVTEVYCLLLFSQASITTRGLSQSRWWGRRWDRALASTWIIIPILSVRKLTKTMTAPPSRKRHIISKDYFIFSHNTWEVCDTTASYT